MVNHAGLTRSRIASGQIWEDLLDAGIIGASPAAGRRSQRGREVDRAAQPANGASVPGCAGLGYRRRPGRTRYGEIAPENLTIADGRVLNTEAAGKLDAHSPGRQWLAVNVDGLRPINEQQGPAAATRS